MRDLLVELGAAAALIELLLWAAVLYAIYKKNGVEKKWRNTK